MKKYVNIILPLWKEALFVLTFEVKIEHNERFNLPTFVRTGERVKNMRVKITMACSECKQRNYDTMKNKKNNPDRIEMNKYCRFCKKHTLHKETK